MLQSIKDELKEYIIQSIDDGVLTDENIDDWHHEAFNTNYYIIGYYKAEQWLQKHGLSAFKAIDICMTYEKDNFGECHKNYDNAESVVNMLTYIYGEELIYGANADNVEELRESMES